MSQNQGVVIPLRWKPSEHLPTIHVNQLRVVYTNLEFYLVFGEIDPVSFAFSPDDPPEYLDIQPTAKVAVPHSQMSNFAEALQKNLEKFTEHYMTSNEDEEQ